MMCEEQPSSPRFIFTDSWNFKLGLDGVRRSKLQLTLLQKVPEL